jgi:uncharacterized protein (DUF302 family)
MINAECRTGIRMTNALQLFQRSHDMPATKTSYAIGKSVPLPYEQAVERMREALLHQGFGVLTEIDVQGTLKKKLGLDFRPYRILGACNPPLAHRALSADPQIGLLLPCNVVVQEAEGGGVIVSIADPRVMFTVVDNPALAPIVDEVDARLRRVIAAV